MIGLVLPEPGCFFPGCDGFDFEPDPECLCFEGGVGFFDPGLCLWVQPVWQ